MVRLLINNNIIPVTIDNNLLSWVGYENRLF